MEVVLEVVELVIGCFGADGVCWFCMRWSWGVVVVSELVVSELVVVLEVVRCGGGGGMKVVKTKYFLVGWRGGGEGTEGGRGRAGEAGGGRGALRLQAVQGSPAPEG